MYMLQLIFIFPLFLGMVMYAKYANQFEQRKNKN